jgi:hypothetical protein
MCGELAVKAAVDTSMALNFHAKENRDGYRGNLPRIQDFG